MQVENLNILVLFVLQYRQQKVKMMIKRIPNGILFCALKKESQTKDSFIVSYSFLYIYLLMDIPYNEVTLPYNDIVQRRSSDDVF